MNKREAAILQEFPKALDKAVNDRFGAEVECESTYNILHMSYVTTYKAEGDLKTRIDEFIAGWLAGHEDLADRLKDAKAK